MPWDEDNVRKDILAPAVRLASQRLVERGIPPLPHITPHSLRRTYVSIMLLATEFDISFVQRQVGHTHASMTLDVYNQLLDRGKREHGAAFDALLASARSTLYGASAMPSMAVQPTTQPTARLATSARSALKISAVCHDG
jgi:hypothetical protein